MAQIGEISTIVTAKTAPFSKGMSRAKNDAKQFGKTAKTSIAGTLKKSVAPAFSKLQGMLTSPAGVIASFATAALTIRKFSGSITHAAGKLDEIGKTASRLDMATDELMALEFAGQQTGVSFNELQKGLEKFNKRIGLAADGSGEAAGTMKRLGINAQEFIKLPISERLATIAGKIEGAGNAAERAAIADKMFGRAGASSLLNLLQQGDDGIRALTDAARNMGLVMETHVVTAIEQANDKMNEFKQRGTSLTNQLTGELYPAMNIALEDLEKVMEGAGAEAALKKKTLGEKLVDAYTKYVPAGIMSRPWILRGRARVQQLEAKQPLDSYRDLRQSRQEREAERARALGPGSDWSARGGSEAYARARQQREQRAEKQRQAMITEQRKARQAQLEQLELERRRNDGGTISHF